MSIFVIIEEKRQADNKIHEGYKTKQATVITFNVNGLFF